MDPVADFLTHLTLERGASRHTVAAYRGDLAQLRDFLRAREVEIDDASADDLEAFAGALERAGLAPATRRRRLAAARSLMRHRGRIGARPMDTRAIVALPRLPRRLPRVLSAANCKLLVEHPDASPLGLRDRAALELLYGGGLRVSELTGLRPGDLDLERGIVRVEGKGGRQRVVPTGRLAAEAARRYLARGRPYLGKSQEAAAFLLNASGRRITRQGV
ncbi:MAG: integrase/recombinase XerD, partial [Gaiellales bacterium]|nr:integrase/recombinase XerD [Gaiellales bacterium]